MAAAISQEFGIESELIKGTNDVFDVVVDEKLIFSKYKEGRFPKNEEILDMLRQ